MYALDRAGCRRVFHYWVRYRHICVHSYFSRGSQKQTLFLACGDFRLSAAFFKIVNLLYFMAKTTFFQC